MTTLYNKLCFDVMRESMYTLSEIERLRSLIDDLEAILNFQEETLPIEIQRLGDGSNSFGLFIQNPSIYRPALEKLKQAGFDITYKDPLNICPMRCNQHSDRVQISKGDRYANI